MVTVAQILLLAIAGQPAQATDRVSDGQWFHQFLKTEQAHQMTRGDGAIVAVIDTGIDATHPDLSGSILEGTDLTSAGDGRTDIDGHGTKMASLIVGHGRVRGIAPAAKILPIRVIEEFAGRASKMSVGVRWAIEHGAKVISISSGTDDNLLLRQEIQAAAAADVVVVAAVGNQPEFRSVAYPAAIPGVVAVAGVDKNGDSAAVSVSGPEVVIAAPAVGISGASPGNGYIDGEGTSDATAIVAGAVALIRAKFPQLKAPEVIRRLTATAIDKGPPGHDPSYGFGVLDIVAALTAELPAATSPAAASSRAPSAQPPSTSDRFPWWILILAAVPVAAIVIIAVAWRRRRGGVGL
jgi:type VII secretion-associated serine protease mycosin